MSAFRARFQRLAENAPWDDADVEDGELLEPEDEGPIVDDEDEDELAAKDRRTMTQQEKLEFLEDACNAAGLYPNLSMHVGMKSYTPLSLMAMDARFQQELVTLPLDEAKARVKSMLDELIAIGPITDSKRGGPFYSVMSPNSYRKFMYDLSQIKSAAGIAKMIYNNTMKFEGTSKNMWAATDGAREVQALYQETMARFDRELREVLQRQGR